MCVHPSPHARTGLDRRRLLIGAGTASVVAATGLLTATPAHAATSQNGWYAAPDMVERDMINTTFAAGGQRFPSGVRRKAPVTILGYVARQFNANVEPCEYGCWGYNYRSIGGGSTLSNHASGTALDFNAPKHPQGASGTFSSAQVRQIRLILDYCEGVVRWGGDYSGTKDEMHFELNVGPGSSRIDALVAKING